MNSIGIYLIDPLKSDSLFVNVSIMTHEKLYSLQLLKLRMKNFRC